MRQIFVASTLALACAGAYAQSSVTLYGVVDLYAGVAKGGSVSQTRINDGGNVASQIGFRGSEDLGGGMKAIFTMEAGVSPDTGAGNVPATGAAAGSFGFTRQAYAGLTGGFGSVTMGRQYTPIFRTTHRVDPLGANSVFGTNILWGQIEGQGTGAGAANTFQAWAARSENSIMYSSPTSSPIQGTLMYAPGEQAGNSGGNYLGASLSYNAPGLFVGYGYQSKKNVVANPNTSTGHILAASYEPGPFRIGASYGFQKSDVTGAAKATILNIHGAYNFSDTSTVILSIGRRDVSGGTPAAVNDADNTAITLGYNYNMSKRTTLYARYMRVSNGGTSLVSLGQVTGATAADNDISLLGLGITHRF